MNFNRKDVIQPVIPSPKFIYIFTNTIGPSMLKTKNNSFAEETFETKIKIISHHLSPRKNKNITI